MTDSPPTYNQVYSIYDKEGREYELDLYQPYRSFLHHQGLVIELSSQEKLKTSDLNLEKEAYEIVEGEEGYYLITSSLSISNIKYQVGLLVKPPPTLEEQVHLLTEKVANLETLNETYLEKIRELESKVSDIVEGLVNLKVYSRGSNYSSFNSSGYLNFESGEPQQYNKIFMPKFHPLDMIQWSFQGLLSSNLSQGNLKLFLEGVRGLSVNNCNGKTSFLKGHYQKLVEFLKPEVTPELKTLYLIVERGQNNFVPDRNYNLQISLEEINHLKEICQERNINFKPTW